ncbi:23S rRNA m2A2503 methyltransferase [Phlyctochytrium arcticum]|nr:23S rRNA m2A2503 methyltransferase [Phlyctochytrium arcticum]
MIHRVFPQTSRQLQKRLLATTSLSPPSPLLGVDKEQLTDLLTQRLKGTSVEAVLQQKPYVADQIWHGIYKRGVEELNEITTLSKTLRESLLKVASINNGEIKESLISKDGTRKWLLGFGPKAQVETVYIPTTDSGTVCVSSQVGCSLACSFCHTGTQKLLRNLNADEILSQIMLVMRATGDFPLAQGKARTVSNIVFMGQGEPLLNFRQVSAAIKLLTSPSSLNFAPWRITVSTSGIAPLIESVGKDLKCGLAISLHAVEDDLRDILVPINKQYPIKQVLEGCHNYLEHMPSTSRHRRITFEYVMLDGVNDSMAEARKLIKLLSGIPAHINLIPFNPWPGSQYLPSNDRAIQEFADVIRSARVPVHIRTPRGQDIMAACGQLKSSHEIKRTALRQ